MDYLLENLGPERFQELCQALLAREFPDVQCFPVAQPDGGRDAVAYVTRNPAERSFHIFQVKYVRALSSTEDPHKWLLDVLEKEVSKLKALIPKGAKAYYLLTNVPGTAHPDTGSIDKAEAILRELAVQAHCWWRADLNRRLDDAWNLKWAYPEILSGPDVLRLLVEQGLTEDRERRTSAVRAFVRSQYELDQEVRFKQVELQNKLLDLFVDVPIGEPEIADDRQRYAVWRGLTVAPSRNDEDETGAATFFLSSMAQRLFPLAVLEGGPGQGKSTIAQYICQIHRMRLLEETRDWNVVPAHQRPQSLRVPMKVGLRDFATWLNRENPFDPERSEVPPAAWAKSLESFLAALIRHHSGGVDFSVADLHAFAKVSALLLILDGLDEVADISKRRQVVAEVRSGVSRLTEGAASLQVIVTSRPAAFANSPGFPHRAFPHFHLGPLAREGIDDYAERWLQARRVFGREAAEVKRILRLKLEMPHLMVLARNPMQLAILLSLIHTRGTSLPDKRTALYDSYVELFLSREAEKAEIVREHRDLLKDLHGYLAWRLHGEAEKGRHSGSVSNQVLQDLIEKYLRAEGRDPTLVMSLFAGMVERVVFLVSRVEGTFEFEVQPLREYFAGRHLYETAPYSPPGAEKRGTKPDRFDGLARNFYWLNVTRFFAGCFSKGELPALIERLQALAEEHGYRDTYYAARLAAMLLADWVFSQNQRATRGAVRLVLESLSTTESHIIQ